MFYSDNSLELSALVNTADPRQDVHRVRSHHPHLHRYVVAERLLPADLSGMKVLELGGGIGELSRRLSNKGADITFVDLSPANIRRARDAGWRAHQIDLNTGLGPIDDESADIVVMLEIIEHVVGAEFLLSEVERVLRPGGSLVLSTPNFAFLLNRLRVIAGRLSVDEGYHYRFFTREVLHARIESAGMEVEAEAHSSPAIGLNIIRNRVLGRPRMHVGVPAALASLFAQTLMVRAVKPRRLSREETVE